MPTPHIRMSSSTWCRRPIFAATRRAVVPSSRDCDTSAPLRSMYSATPTPPFPDRHATIRGVYPSSFRLERRYAARSRSRSSTIARFPTCAPMWSDVQPPTESLWSTSAPWDTKSAPRPRGLGSTRGAAVYPPRASSRLGPR